MFADQKSSVERQFILRTNYHILGKVDVPIIISLSTNGLVPINIPGIVAVTTVMAPKGRWLKPNYKYGQLLSKYLLTSYNRISVH